MPIFLQKPEIQKTFPRRTLVQTMHGTEILLHTRLIQWYVKQGFSITRIYKMFEYQKFGCYKDVHDRVYHARVKATQENNNKKATAIKLVSNSMYGQMIMVCFLIFCNILQYNIIFAILYHYTIYGHIAPYCYML